MFERQWFEDIGMPEEWTFHTILRQRIAGADMRDNDSILETLRLSYRELYDLADTDPDPDVWVVAEAWFRELEL